MVKSKVNSINETYLQLLSQQTFVSEKLDYSVLEKHKPSLQKLAETSNSAISVFDLYKHTHVFLSSNFGSSLGYSLQDFKTEEEHFLDSKVHPDDFIVLIQNAVTALKLVLNFSVDEKLNNKIISEYRILNADGNYVRVIEQQQVLELDTYSNYWLGLSILDISPNQKDMHEGIKSQLLNFRTGKIISFTEPKEDVTNALTKREIEILKMVRDGFLSKEISDKLTISLHTVNTHRQKILEKFDVNNSMEAVMLASKLGLI
jgi:DNA-binding CsgD family transcriptional regulator